MRQKVRARFWLESSLAGLLSLLAVATLFWRDWIEALSGVDPDRHSGLLEWLVVAGLLMLAGAATAGARVEWRRWRPAVV
jgi:hypothetical protein